MPVRLAPTAPKKPNRTRVDFTPDRFRTMIFHKGHPILWERGAYCPCTQVYTGVTASSGVRPRQNCPACYGLGIIYHGATETIALFEDAAVDPERYGAFGTGVHGRAALTLLPENFPSIYDRYTILDQTIIHHEVKVRRETVERLRWPVVTRNVETASIFNKAEGVPTELRVTYCRRADIDGNILSGELVESVDFKVTTGGEIDWTLGVAKGTAPAIGARYSVAYFSNPRYVLAGGVPYIARDTMTKRKKPVATVEPMPIRVQVTLEYLGQNLQDRTLPVDEQP